MGQILPLKQESAHAYTKLRIAIISKVNRPQNSDYRHFQVNKL